MNQNILIDSAGIQGYAASLVSDPSGERSSYSVAHAERHLHARLRKIIPQAYRASTSHHLKEDQ